MPLKVGINGFGRIGKLVFRMIREMPDLQVVMINDTMPKTTLLHLLKYDSAHGPFGKQATLRGDVLVVEGEETLITSFPKPADIPWKAAGVDIVVEASGMFRTREGLAPHLSSGASKVILSCPSDEPLDLTYILGLNDDLLRHEHVLVSNASCTANCAGPLLRILDSAFGIESCFLNTVHPATNNQRIIDAPHSDLRRSRTCINNIIPTSSTAIAAICSADNSFQGRLDGMATRVPVNDGSLLELCMAFRKDTSAEQINFAVKQAADTSHSGVVAYSEDPLVSADINGCRFSALFDSLSTRMLGNRYAQLIAWYDNETGYAARVTDLILKMA